MMTQRIQGLAACITALICCCLLLATTATADRDTDKALRAQQAKTIKAKNPHPVGLRDVQQKKQNGNSLSANKNQQPKKHYLTGRTRPEKAPFAGHPTPPDPNVIRQGGDNIASAFTISSLPFAESGTTTGYGDDYDEICPYDAAGSADVVYKYVATSDAQIDISLCESGYDTKVYVYENSVGNVVGCNDDADACDLLYRSELLNVPVSTGNTYYIVIDGYGGDDGTYDLSITEHTACAVTCPVNHVDEGEACGDSTNDGCNVSVPSFGEVKCGDTICGTAWADGGFRDTDWYLKTIGGDTTITWCGTANFDFVLIIANLSGGCENLDDGDIVDALDGGPCDTVCLTATLSAGTYLFFVAPATFEGFACANGPWNYVAWLDCAEPPPGPANNSCSNPIAVGNVTNYAFTNINATTDGPDEPGSCDFFGYTQIGSDVWFCYTATCNGVANVALCGSDFDTKVAAYAGCSCPTSAPLACNDDACGSASQIVFPVSMGSTYLIRVGGYEGDQGNGLLTISCGAGAENDNCSDVVPQSLPLVYSSDNSGATNDCDQLAPDAEVWTAFTISECTDVTITYCGTSPAFETVYALLVEGCPCGNAILYDDGNFDDCGDGNATIFFNQVPAGTYYVPILSSIADGAYGPFTITITGTACPPGYCEAAGGICDEYISRVAVGSIDNSSDCDNYADYTSLSTTMDIGTGYPITVENGFPYSSDQCGIWVDWNQNDNFTDPGEQISVSGTPGVGPYTATITPPGGASAGPTRMRVRITYTGAVSPCGVTQYGEVEDYTVIVSGGPAGADLTVAPDTIKAAMSATIDPLYATLMLGNNFAPGYDVNDINLASVLVNGSAPDSSGILPGAAGFTGPVLRLRSTMDHFIHPTYQSAVGISPQTATVSGSMTDATPFSTVSESFVYYGHPVGDLNKDGRVTITDLTFMVSFLMAGGQPPFTLAVADVNHNGKVTITDLTYLVSYLFNGGPAPIQQQ